MWECQTVAARSDSPSVRRDEDEHLRKFVAARAAGDGAEMRRWWGELVTDFFDRMDGLVALAHKGALNDDEHQDAVQESFRRFAEKLIDSFEGVSMGELVNATKRLCWFAFKDVQRDAAKHRTRSLDRGWDGDDDSPNWETNAAREAHQAQEEEADTKAFLAWAMPQLLESRRGVVERTFACATLEEICAEFELSPDNAYQRRSRGLKDLAKLYQQYDA